MNPYHPVSENLNATEPETGGEAEGNCVVTRRGGEQPDAKEQSQTKVNWIRQLSAASLLAVGEACAERELKSRQIPGSDDFGAGNCGSSENVPKEIWLNGENCPDRTCGGDSARRTEVRAAVRATKSGNADGAKGGREANASSNRHSEERPAEV